MRMIGNEVHIQRGEIWSLDFAVTDKNNHPLALLKDLRNPYIVITVAASLYEQKGDYRESYWLDLDKRWVEDANGDITLETCKRFTSTEPLPLDSTPTSEGEYFSVTEAIATYGVGAGGKLVLDSTSDFDVTNFLFFVDPDNDGNYLYKYVKEYTVDESNNITDETWETYDFRIVKRFSTRHWMEQGYFYDMKIVTGTSLQERATEILEAQGSTGIKTEPWTDGDWDNYLSQITDGDEKSVIVELYDAGVPLMSDFDAENILLDPTPIYVSVNLQGGVR